MPQSGLLTCSIELGNTNTRLREYGTTYFNRTVEAYIAIPSKSTPFSIRVSSHGYIAPGISVWIYIDGTYQTNRNKRGFLPNGENQNAEFHLGQKDDLLRDGRVISRGWWFEKLNIGKLADEELLVDADTVPTVNSDVLNNLGTIEVVVLRCQDDPKLRVLDPWKFPKLPSASTSPTEGPATDNKSGTSKKKEKKAKAPSDNGGYDGQAFGDMFGMGLFDGAGDDRPFRTYVTPGERHDVSRHHNSHRSILYQPRLERGLEDDLGVTETLTSSSDDDNADYHIRPHSHHEDTPPSPPKVRRGDYFQSTVPHPTSWQRSNQYNQQYNAHARTHYRSPHRRPHYKGEYRSATVFDTGDRVPDEKAIPDYRPEHRIESGYAYIPAPNSAIAHAHGPPSPRPIQHSAGPSPQYSTAAYPPAYQQPRHPQGLQNPEYPILYGEVLAPVYPSYPIQPEIPAPYPRVPPPSVAAQSQWPLPHRNSGQPYSISSPGYHGAAPVPGDKLSSLQHGLRNLNVVDDHDSSATQNTPPFRHSTHHHASRRHAREALAGGLRHHIPGNSMPGAWPESFYHDPLNAGGTPAWNNTDTGKNNSSSPSLAWDFPDGNSTSSNVDAWADTKSEGELKMGLHPWGGGNTGSTDDNAENGWGKSEEKKDGDKLANQLTGDSDANGTNDKNIAANNARNSNDSQKNQPSNTNAWTQQDTSTNTQANSQLDSACSVKGNNQQNNPWEGSNQQNNDPSSNAGWDEKSENKKGDKAKDKAKDKDQRKERKSKSTTDTLAQVDEKPYTRPYWKAQVELVDQADANSSRRRSRYTMPEDPIYTISKEKAKEKHLRHQVRGGKGAEQEKKTYKPIYWDTLEEPYAVFRFKYRSRDMLKKILGEEIRETKEEYQEWLGALTKEQLIAEMLKKKEAGNWSDDEGSDAGSKKVTIKKKDEKDGDKANNGGGGDDWTQTNENADQGKAWDSGGNNNNVLADNCQW